MLTVRHKTETIIYAEMTNVLGISESLQLPQFQLVNKTVEFVNQTYTAGL